MIKAAQALQTLELVDIVIVDKTSTLTEGRPELQMIRSSGTFSKDRLLEIAASVELASEHSAF